MSMEATDLDPQAMQIASLREIAKQLEEELKEKEESFQAFKKKTKVLLVVASCMEIFDVGV